MLNETQKSLRYISFHSHLRKKKHISRIASPIRVRNRVTTYRGYSCSLFYHLSTWRMCLNLQQYRTLLLFTTSICFALHALLHLLPCHTQIGLVHRWAIFILLDSPIFECAEAKARRTRREICKTFWKCTYCHGKYGRIEKYETIRSRIIIEHHTDRISVYIRASHIHNSHRQTAAMAAFRWVYAMYIITFGRAVGVAKTAKKLWNELEHFAHEDMKKSYRKKRAKKSEHLSRHTHNVSESKIKKREEEWKKNHTSAALRHQHQHTNDDRAFVFSILFGIFSIPAAPLFSRLLLMLLLAFSSILFVCFECGCV